MPKRDSKEDIIRVKDSFKEQELLKLTNTQIKMEKELSEFQSQRESTTVRQSQGLGSKIIGILTFGNLGGGPKERKSNTEDNLKLDPKFLKKRSNSFNREEKKRLDFDSSLRMESSIE